MGLKQFKTSCHGALRSSPSSTPSNYDVGGPSPPVATHANLGLVPHVRNMLGVLRSCRDRPDADQVITTANTLQVSRVLIRRMA